jgi:CHAT domain-containing protein/cytochrome c-type biogenesis protein CcmH/NrfG
MRLAALKSSKSNAPATGQRDCPLERDWLPLAAGLLPVEQEQAYLQHALECDHCSLLLCSATEALSNQSTPDEESFLARLRSSDPKWQRSLARLLREKVKASIGEEHSAFERWIAGLTLPHFAAAAGIAAVVGILLWIAIRPSGSQSVERLLAQAYSENRTLEMRFPGTQYAPLRQERGPDNSRLSRPRALLRAESEIADKLARNPKDGRWIIAKGKAELLEGQYSEAIDSFSQAIELDSHSIEATEGLAISYFEQGESTENVIGFGKAVELFSDALKRDPDNPTILFNRALALERLFLYHEAERDWEHYIQLDPRSAWSSEAAKHLKDVRDKLSNHTSALNAAHNLVAYIENLPCDTASLKPSPGLSSSSADELFVEAFVDNWLPLLVDTSPNARSDAQSGIPSRRVLGCLPEVFESRHSDAWLKETLYEASGWTQSGSSDDQFASGIALLSEASIANLAGDPDRALHFSKAALHAFVLAKSIPGVARAREEVTHAYVRQWRAKECIESATMEIRDAKSNSYSWILIQGLLWQATCEAAEGHLDVARELATEALHLAERFKYDGLYLQAILYSSGFLRAPPSEWQDSRVALDLFWSGPHQPIHAFETYTELAVLAEDMGEFHLSRDLRREAVEMVEETSDKSFQAEAHYRLGIAARMSGDLAESDFELREGLARFRKLPDTPGNRYYVAASAIDLAALDLERNNLDEADTLLQSPELTKSTALDSLNALNYNQVAGELCFRRADLKGAEKSLFSAISIAQARLSSLKTETDRLNWETDAGPTYRSLVEVTLARGQPANALEQWEAFRATTFPHSATINLPLKSPQLALVPNSERHSTVRRSMDDFSDLTTETVLTYAVLKGGVAIWVFDNRGAHFSWSSLRPDELRERIIQFGRMCSTPASDQDSLNSESLYLYRALIAPVEEYLDSTRLLVIEADTPLLALPWSALLDEHDHSLIERFSIAISPGLEYLRRLKSYPSFRPTDRALVVVPQSVRNADSSRFVPLPDAAREAESVAARFSGSRVLSGRAATLEQIRHNLADVTVLHFSGHGIAEVDQSGLVVESPDKNDKQMGPSILSAQDFDGMRLGSLRLVVLSACSTARSRGGLNDPNSLVRVLLRARIPHVIASQWNVDSTTAAETMDTFYLQLLKGQSVPRALQSSIVGVKHSPGKSHPYYWAVFSTYGN